METIELSYVKNTIHVDAEYKENIRLSFRITMIYF